MKRTRAVLAAVFPIAILFVVSVLAGRGEDPHDDHDHSADGQATPAPGPVKSEPGHEAPASGLAASGDGHDHDAHADETNRVTLTPAQRERIGLRLQEAAPGAIATSVAFPGEVILDPDRLAHVVPRAAGIVREVKKTLGERVEAGEILAWIESDALAEAKLAFYEAQSEVGCCLLRLPRAREIFENTYRMLELLKGDPGLEALAPLEGQEMGPFRGLLVTAYADYTASRKAHARERALHEKKISSEKDLLDAEAAHQKAAAAYQAALDTARFQVLSEYNEAARIRQVAEFKVVAAEQRLRLKGADDAVIARLRALVPRMAGLKPCLCTDPDCQERVLPSVTETLAKDARFAWYPLRAPFAGFVAEQHLPRGESVGTDTSVLAVADLSTVWVRFNVYQRDLASVKAGQTVRVDLGQGETREGVVAYLSPTIDETTRTIPSRVVLTNADGLLRPGLYVTVHVTVRSVDAPVVIPRAAVQVLDAKDVVFVVDGDGFVTVPVRLGPSDRDRVAVLEGLRAGQAVVTKGAFEIKSQIVTGGLGSHAGHGH